jgi:hypothetical protein
MASVRRRPRARGARLTRMPTYEARACSLLGSAAHPLTRDRRHPIPLARGDLQLSWASAKGRAPERARLPAQVRPRSPWRRTGRVRLASRIFPSATRRGGQRTLRACSPQSFNPRGPSSRPERAQGRAPSMHRSTTRRCAPKGPATAAACRWRRCRSPEAGGVGRAGLRNATIQLDASETGGQAQIAIDHGAPRSARRVRGAGCCAPTSSARSWCGRSSRRTRPQSGSAKTAQDRTGAPSPPIQPWCRRASPSS